jgi:hypothetical protein
MGEVGRSQARLALALGLLSLPSAACMRAQARGAAQLPAVAARFTSMTVPDTVVFQRSITRAGADSGAGTRTLVLRVLEARGGADLLEVVQRFPGSGGEIVDTALAELATLRAVAHQSHQPARTMRFSFAGSSVEGTVSAAGTANGSISRVRQELGGPVFDSNIIELVVAALPLRQGFRAELPFFIYERGGRVPMSVAVRDRVTTAFAHLGRRDGWVVAVDVPGAPATVWVDGRTHAVLRVRYAISARGMSVTDERLTPLRG